MSDDDPGDTDSGGTAAEDVVALEIRRRREAAGLSQRALAKRAGFSREYLSRAERPSQGLPSENLVAVLDAVLDAGGALMDLWSEAAGARRGRRRQMSRSGRAAGSAGRARRSGADVDLIVADTHDAPVGGRAIALTEQAGEGDAWSKTVAGRSAVLLAEVVATDIDQLTIDDIEERVDALANGYFRTSPVAFRLAAVRLRQRVRDLVAVRSTLRQRRRMYGALAALTGMLAESSFAIGDQTDVHCATAIALAEEAGHAGLVGWVRGTQAQIALHTGNPVAAARYAGAGASAPRGSTASVRAAAYLARASARVGDRLAAREAWCSAQRAWDDLDGTLTDSVFSLCPDYLFYCELTMSAWLGEVGQAQRLVEDGKRVGEVATVGRAIGQIDIGLVRVLSGDLDEAVRHGHRALAIGGTRLTTPLRDRFTDLVEALSSFDLPDVHELRRRWMWISA